MWGVFPQAGLETGRVVLNDVEMGFAAGSHIPAWFIVGSCTGVQNLISCLTQQPEESKTLGPQGMGTSSLFCLRHKPSGCSNSCAKYQRKI